MTGILAISEYERQHIAIALEAARKKTKPWAVMQEVAIKSDSNTINLNERINPKRIEQIQREYPPQRVQLGTYEAAVSFEEQPAGVFKHLSVSSRKPGMVPNEHVVQMVMEAFDFSGFPPVRLSRFWIEEFEPGHHAVNIIELEP